jgi:uncharacterized membrane protein
MSDPTQEAQAAAASDPSTPVTFRALLTSHRSLGPAGFLVLMGALTAVSFLAGVVFVMLGAWPVTLFFGLDVLLIYIAFRRSYYDGRAYETIELSAGNLNITHQHASGRRESFDFNPYWARVVLRRSRDGRTDLRIRVSGREHAFGRLLTDEERADLAAALANALLEARGGLRI